MSIQFDEKNLLADMVGNANGLSRSEIERSKGKALKALKSFRRQSDEGRYGFPHLPFQTGVIQAIGRYAEEARGSFDTVCIVGIGGSALGAWALDCGIRGPHPVQGAFSRKHPRLVIMDNIDPAFTAQALASMDARKTIALVIAKSGTTAETVSTFLIVRDWLETALGADPAPASSLSPPKASMRAGRRPASTRARSVSWPPARGTARSAFRRTWAAVSACFLRWAWFPPR